MVKRTLFVLVAALGRRRPDGGSARANRRRSSPAVMAFPGVRPGPVRVPAPPRQLRRDRVRRPRHHLAARGRGPDRRPPSPRRLPRPSSSTGSTSSPPLGASFGLHAAAVVGGRLRLLYLDRESEDRQLLKCVAGGRRRDGASSWSSRSGCRSRCSPGPMGRRWTSGRRDPCSSRGTAGDRSLWPRSFRARHAALPRSPRRRRSRGIRGLGRRFRRAARRARPARRACGPTRSVRGAGPVLALARGAGRDPGRRRRGMPTAAASCCSSARRAPRAFRSTTVTVCDGVNGLFLAWTPSGWLFVYDEVRSARARPVDVGSRRAVRRDREGGRTTAATVAACSSSGPGADRGLARLVATGVAVRARDARRTCGC